MKFLVVLLAAPFLESPDPVESAGLAQTQLTAADYPGDKGNQLLISWNRVADDQKVDRSYGIEVVSKSDNKLVFSKSFKSLSDGKDYLEINLPLPFWVHSKSESKYCIVAEVPKPDSYVVTLKIDGTESAHTETASVENIFAPQKLNNMVIVLAAMGLVIYMTRKSKKRELFIRKLAGLDALEEAIGRATEMGKPVVYQLGLMEIGESPLSSISLVASFSILSEVAYKVAVYETPLLVPHRSAINMVICQEITKEAYTRAGKPHLYKEDSNFFVSVDQFAYVSKLEGIYMRDKPATCIYMGYFFAESLMLAESAATVGAIQIAGTDSYHQLPFFFAACDYTLIGEELYAAGAYLSKEPTLLAGIKVQDYLRLAIVGVCLMLTLAATSGLMALTELIIPF